MGPVAQGFFCTAQEDECGVGNATVFDANANLISCGAGLLVDFLAPTFA